MNECVKSEDKALTKTVSAHVNSFWSFEKNMKKQRVSLFFFVFLTFRQIVLYKS